MLGLGLSSWQAAARLRAGPQAVLGAALLGWWDAARTDRMVLAGSNVTSWADLVAGVALTQGVSGAKPLWTLDEGGRPAVQFDGTDDYLEQATHGFPAGQFELWLVGSNTAPVADAGSRWAFGIGTTSPATIGRNASTGANRARGAFGSSGWNAGYGDFTGTHVVRLRGEAAQAWIGFDGGAPTLLGNFGPVGAGRIRMGCQNNGSPSGFWQGAIHAALVTTLLSDTQAAQTLRWCKDRGGIA